MNDAKTIHELDATVRSRAECAFAQGHGFGADFSMPADRAWIEGYAYALATQPQPQEAAPHPDDAAVDALATRMKVKLAEQRAKGYVGWDTPECTRHLLSCLLRDHVDKGDPVDVANFCAFLSARGEGIAKAAPSQDAPELTATQIERGWKDTFSTENPFCPCNLKSFTKAVRWAERAARALTKEGGK